MSIEQTKSVDYIGIDKKTGSVVLTITDHLQWVENESDHLLMLQDKINSYLGFIESEEIWETCPEVRNQKVVISIVGKFPLSLEAKEFVKRAKLIVGEAGVGLSFELYGDTKYDG